MRMTTADLRAAQKFSRITLVFLVFWVVIATISFSSGNEWFPFLTALLVPFLVMNLIAHLLEFRLMTNPAKMFRSYLGMPLVAIAIGLAAYKNQSVHGQFYHNFWWLIGSIVATIVIGLWFRTTQGPTRTPYNVMQFWSPTKIINDYLVVPLLVFMLLYRGMALFYGSWAGTIAAGCLLVAWVKLSRYDARHFKRLAHPWYDWNKMKPYYYDEDGRPIRF